MSYNFHEKNYHLYEKPVIGLEYEPIGIQRLIKIFKEQNKFA